MTVLPTHRVREKLNRVKNISLYGLLINLNTRAGGGDVEVK